MKNKESGETVAQTEEKLGKGLHGHEGISQDESRLMGPESNLSRLPRKDATKTKTDLLKH